jgi:Zn-dependent M28 family amino/carboxypeptidase
VNTVVTKIVNSISEIRLRAIVEDLSSYHTRNSFSSDAVQAASFLADTLATLGCLNVRTVPFQSGYAPNVFCEIPGTDPSADAVYVGGHYDSRGIDRASPTERAPGADDNGTGSAGVLEILRAIRAAISDGDTFRRTISFCLWAGEEQGLVGSAYESRRLFNAGVGILAYVNLDMIGYPEPSRQETLWWVYRAVDTTLTDMAVELSKTYLGEDTDIDLSLGCCSDQQSFYGLGYPAVSVFESTAASRNPNYHRPSDLPNTVDYNHVMRTTQMAAALIGTLLEPSESN